MDTLLQDIRFSLRTLRKSPVFTIVAAATLALGIGANTAVFSVVNGVLLRDLPYEEPDRLTLIWTNFGPDLPQNWVSGPEFVEMREFQTQFEDIGVVVPTTVSFTGQGEPEQIGAAGASGGFFQVLRVSAAHGRLFGPEDDTPASAPVAVLDHGFWQRRFGGEESVVGRTLTADGVTYTVIGVLPPDFRVRHPDAQFPDRIDMWAPMIPILGAEYEQLGRGGHFLRAFGRMRPGVSLAQAEADMHSTAVQMQERTPQYYDGVEGWDITVLSLHQDLVEDVKPALIILLVAVLFVLLIACVNVANLQLTRAAGREREIALRSALGAGRGRLFRQLLTESLVLGLVGSALGLVVAFGLVRVLIAVAPDALPLRDVIGIDGTVLLFTFALAVATALLFGLAPGLVSLKRSLFGSLKEGGRGSTAGIGGARLRTALVVSEIALAIVLLVGAGLMMHSLNRLLSADPGYSTEQLITLQISLPNSRYDAEATRSFWDRLVERAEALPGVDQVGLVSHLPLSGAYASGTTRVERSEAMQPDPGDNFASIEAERRWVSPEYFQTMGIQLIAGRMFTIADNIDAPLVAIVDEEFARRFWPGENPIGQRISINQNADGRVWREVVGLVRHSRHYDPGTIGREAAYYPYAQAGVNTMFLAARTSTDPASVTSAVREAVWALDPDQPVSDIRTMEDRVGGAVAQPQFNLWLLAAFALIALLLAGIGIYGVIAYSVGQRRHEVGVRMALGADRADVRSLFLRQGMVLVAVGVALGVVAALGLSRLLTSLLYEVSPADPVTYIAVALVLSTVAVGACLIPAMVATRVEPVSVLREE
jgi:putative ABC transport system permease protein